MRRLISTAFVLSSSLVAACGEDTVENTPPPVVETRTADLAAAKFWEVFYAGDWNKLPEARTLLEKAYGEDPKDPKNTFLLAHSYLWEIGESERDPSIDAGPAAQKALQYFSEAAELNPSDARIPGWIAGMLLGAAGGLSQSPDPADQAQAQMMQQRAGELIEQGIQRMPEFFYFLRGILFDELPVDHPLFGVAVESYMQGFDACLDETLDRANPDYGPYMARATTEGPNKVCWSGGVAPHALEGIMLRVGDVMIKKGDIAMARVFYNNAKKSPTYESWKFKSDIDARLSSDLDARAAAYRDQDPDNDPALGRTPEGCVSCHGR